MEYLGYIASVFMGLSLGMIGGGGSILTVPILVYLFGITPVLSTAYSLFIVGLTALVGGFTYLQKGEVDLKTGFIFAVPSFIGVYLTRAFVMPKIHDPVLIMSTFAILMLLASISMIRSKKTNVSPATLTPVKRNLLIAIEGLVVGGVTGFVGAGGGFLIIPALVILVGMPMKRAVGTSLFIIATKSLIGFTGDLQNNVVIQWPLLFTVSTIAIIGLFIGARLAKKIDEVKLKKGFGYFVLFMGTYIIIDQVVRL